MALPSFGHNGFLRKVFMVLFLRSDVAKGVILFKNISYIRDWSFEHSPFSQAKISANFAKVWSPVSSSGKGEKERNLVDPLETDDSTPGSKQILDAGTSVELNIISF